MPVIVGCTMVLSGLSRWFGARCTHLGEIHDVAPRTGACPACEAAGASWKALWLCLTCGSVGCSDDSPMRHARGHYEWVDHPIVGTLEPGSRWGWCYADHVQIRLPRQFQP
jgi:uncharacterized UBP type Zn finger protein